MASSSSPLLYNYDIYGQRRLISNPLFTVLRSFVPERIKEVFLLCDFLVYNSEQVLAALKKFSEYPVTEVTVTANSDNLHDKYWSLLNENLKIKSFCLISGFDRKLYGNSFTTIYYPFIRFLRCTACSHEVSITVADYTFDAKSFSFSWKCPACDHGRAEIVDKKDKRPDKISLIRWDPKDVVINYDNMSDSSEYYLRVSDRLIDKVLRGDKFTLSVVPLGIFRTIKDQQSNKAGKPVLFKFKSDEIYHMRELAPAGINYGWGIPPIMAALNAIFYVNTLRKANEAIALERMVSFRVMHPGQRTANAEPAIRVRLDNWVNEMKANYERFRVDPNHIMFSPVPVDVSNVGGDGKLLLSIAELEAAETNILLALGIPREFVYGGLNNLGGSITLRNLENQLLNHSDDLTGLSQWIASRCGKFLGWADVDVVMAPFKLIDDVQQKAADLQLFQLGLLSKKTLMQMHSHNYEDELEQQQKEAIDDFKQKSAVDEQVTKLQNQLQEQVKANVLGQGGAAAGGGSEQILQEASQYFQQLVQMPYEERKSYLHQIQQQDYVLYSVLTKMLEEQTDKDGKPPPGGFV